ncbi:unnamed protein product [Lymnaea stagnalis]|uniref:Secreted protein n=1 Tax=Lymnaea stagnalis TaxID=6523 RepID=A0AAV2IFE2_LYMST
MLSTIMLCSCLLLSVQGYVNYAEPDPTSYQGVCREDERHEFVSVENVTRLLSVCRKANATRIVFPQTDLCSYNSKKKLFFGEIESRTKMVILKWACPVPVLPKQATVLGSEELPDADGCQSLTLGLDKCPLLKLSFTVIQSSNLVRCLPANNDTYVTPGGCDHISGSGREAIFTCRCTIAIPGELNKVQAT